MNQVKKEKKTLFRRTTQKKKVEKRDLFLATQSRWFRLPLLYPFLILLLMIGILFWRHTEIKKQESLLVARRKEAQNLMEVGFFSEAIKMLEENPTPRDAKDQRLLFHAYLGRSDYQGAKQAWSLLDPEQQKETMESLFLGLAEDGNVSQAWKLLATHQDLLSANEQTDMGYLLLTYLQEMPVEAEFVDGWVHQDLAVLRDGDGCYLVDANGQKVSSDHYESLRPIQEGFLAMKQGKEILLDPKGHFLSLHTEDISREEIEALPSFEVVADWDGQFGDYVWRDQRLTRLLYEKMSPISRHGVGYVKCEGKNYQLRFDALRDGVAFNKIE